MNTRNPKPEELPKGYVDGELPSYSPFSSHSPPSVAYVTEALGVQTEDLLDHLLNRFRELNGDIVMKEVEDIRDTFKDFDIVCNCTGLGSRRLLNDEQVPRLFLCASTLCLSILHLHRCFLYAVKSYGLDMRENLEYRYISLISLRN